MDEDNRSASVQEVVRVSLCVCVCVSTERALHDDTERQMPTTAYTSPHFMFSRKPT